MSTENHFLAALLDTTAEGVIIFNSRGEVVRFNDRAAAILQLDPAQLKTGKPLPSNLVFLRAPGEPFPPEENPIFLTGLQGLSRENVTMGFRTGQHPPVWVKVSSRLVVMGETRYVLAVYQEAPPKQKTNSRKNRWQLALESSDLGIWDWNLQTGELSFTDYWEKILGYTAGDFRPTFEDWERLIHPDDRAFVESQLAALFAGSLSTSHIEHRLRSKDGTYRWIGATGKIIARSPEGHPLRLLGTIRDIHRVKVAAEKLKLSENKFWGAFEFSAIGIALVNADGHWIEVNPALCQMLGYTREEMIAKTFQDITHPEDLDEDLANLRLLLDREVESYQIEKRYIKKNGHFLWVTLTVSGVWKSDEPEFLVAQVVDISATRHLIGELEWKNDSLNTLSLDLENKISQLEEFNRIVAHNLRGPATNIKMLLEFLPTAAPAVREAEYYHLLLESSDNLLGTLNDLMKIVEVRLNRHIQFDQCVVSELLQKLYSSFRVQIMEKEVTLEEDLALPIISYPKVYLESILYNLIGNAIKYSRPGVKPVIRIRTFLRDGKSNLEVQDNGLGIDLEKYGSQVFKLKKIFHKGFDSKGVGLFITKNQIETFGGEISVKSIPGEGSTFTVTF